MASTFQRLGAGNGHRHREARSSGSGLVVAGGPSPAESDPANRTSAMAPLSESLRIRLQILGAMLLPALALAFWLNNQGFFQKP